MRSGDGGFLLGVSVQGGVVEPALKGKVVVVVLLPARVVNVRANLVTSDDRTNTLAGAALTRRNGDHSIGTSRSHRDGGGKSQNESREVLHCDDDGDDGVGRGLQKGAMQGIREDR